MSLSLHMCVCVCIKDIYICYSDIIQYHYNIVSLIYRIAYLCSFAESFTTYKTNFNKIINILRVKAKTFRDIVILGKYSIISKRWIMIPTQACH